MSLNKKNIFSVFVYPFTVRCICIINRGVIPIGEVDITTMCLQLSDQTREYSYFSPRTMATWVGPGYWLFKPGHKRKSSTSLGVFNYKC